MIADLIVGYEFDVGVFLLWEMWDRVVGVQKALLTYPRMITQICLVLGVLELPGINEMIKAWWTFAIVQIRDAANFLYQPMRQATDIFTGIFP